MRDPFILILDVVVLFAVSTARVGFIGEMLFKFVIVIIGLKPNMIDVFLSMLMWTVMLRVGSWAFLKGFMHVLLDLMGTSFI